jgi:transcriptional regulator with XRE-family HTH domain
MYFIEKINDALRIKKMNKSQLAKKAGLASSTITDLMKGRIKNPSTDLMSKIALALGISIDELLRNDFEVVDRNSGKFSISNFKYKKEDFIGENLRILRGDRTYEEYASYLKEKGGEIEICIDSFFLKKYESNKEIPELEVVKYISEVEGISIDFFYISIKDIAVNAMKQSRDELYFMEAAIKRWVKEPENYKLILLAYNTYKTIRDEG